MPSAKWSYAVEWSKVSNVCFSNYNWVVFFVSLFLFNRKNGILRKKMFVCVYFDFSVILFGFKRSLNVVQNQLNQHNVFRTVRRGFESVFSLFKILIGFHSGCSINFKQHRNHVIPRLVQRFNVLERCCVHFKESPRPSKTEFICWFFCACLFAARCALTT